MKILLLEDDVALNKAITKVTKLDHHSTASYYNGKDVYDDLDYDFDLYIFDINVPNVSGLELLDMLMEQNSSAKVIIISSNIDVDSLQKAYNLGCLDYIRKPFHLEELRIKIDKLDFKVPEFQLIEKLTKKEKDFLYLLASQQGKLVTYQMIEDQIYKDKLMSMDALRALVKRIRAKLKNDIIENVLDEGYKISNAKTV